MPLIYEWSTQTGLIILEQNNNGECGNEYECRKHGNFQPRTKIWLLKLFRLKCRECAILDCILQPGMDMNQKKKKKKKVVHADLAGLQEP